MLPVFKLLLRGYFVIRKSCKLENSRARATRMRLEMNSDHPVELESIVRDRDTLEEKERESNTRGGWSEYHDNGDDDDDDGFGRHKGTGKDGWKLEC